MDTFADRLRFARHQRQLSQGALARASGLSQSAISSYESGHRKTTKEIFRLAEVLKVSPTWLSLGTGPMDPSATTNLAASSREVSEFLPPSPQFGSWPFKELKEADYWALTERQRRLVDRVVASMVKTLGSE